MTYNFVHCFAEYKHFIIFLQEIYVVMSRDILMMWIPFGVSMHVSPVFGKKMVVSNFVVVKLCSGNIISCELDSSIQNFAS